MFWGLVGDIFLYILAVMYEITGVYGVSTVRVMT